MNWFSTNYEYVDEISKEWNHSVQKTRWINVAIAALMIIAGAFCIYNPVAVYSFIQIVAGFGFIAFGIVEIIQYFTAAKVFRDLIWIFIGVLDIALGFLLFIAPATITATTFVIMAAVLLMMHGAQKISFASRMKSFQLMDTKFMTLGGILSIVFSLSFLLMPLVSAVIMSYVLAAYLIASGVTLLIEAISMKKIAPKVAVQQ